MKLGCTKLVGGSCIRRKWLATGTATTQIAATQTRRRALHPSPERGEEKEEGIVDQNHCHTRVEFAQDHPDPGEQRHPRPDSPPRRSQRRTCRWCLPPVGKCQSDAGDDCKERRRSSRCDQVRHRSRIVRILSGEDVNRHHPKQSDAPSSVDSDQTGSASGVERPGMRGHQPRLPGLGFEEMTSRSRGVLLALAILVASLSGPVTTAGAEPGIAVATNRILAGVYAPQQWSSAEHIQALNAASTTKISIGGIWYDVGDRSSNMVHLLDQIWSAGATPFVNIHVGVSAAEVAAGAVDHLIRNLGTTVSYWLSKGEGRSVMLAPMPEMNGDWIPYGKTPNAFKDAYRRFVTLASESGSFERVRWVFAPNGWSAPPHKMAAYYPGADVVDLVGISAYNWGSLQAGARWTTVRRDDGRCT